MSKDIESTILKAASSVFVKDGYDGARMSGIAEKAGINKALLHYYFRSKNHLFQMVFERIMHEFFSAIFREVTMDADFRSYLENFVSAYLNTISKKPYVIRFMIWELGHGSGTVNDLIGRIMKKWEIREMPIITAVQRAVERGEIRAVDPTQLFISIIALCIFPFAARPILENKVEGLKVLSKEFVEARKEAILDLIWNGIAPEKEDFR